MANRTIELQANLIIAMRAVAETTRALWEENLELIAGAQADLTMGPHRVAEALRRLDIAVENARAIAATGNEEPRDTTDIEASLAADYVKLARQYRNDLKHPPSDESRQRKIAMIDAALAKSDRNPPL